MTTSAKNWMREIIVVGFVFLYCNALPASTRIEGSKIIGSVRPLTGVYRSTYKDPRPARSTSRNLARVEAISAKDESRIVWTGYHKGDLTTPFYYYFIPISERKSRSSKPSPLATRLLQERQSPAENSDSYSTQTVHEVEGDHKIQPSSYQTYGIDTSQDEQEIKVEQHDHHEDDKSDGKYQYVYQVQGNKEEGGDYGHAESRDGHKTWGRYFVHQPDGRIKTVRYWADDTGYHAMVDYHGEAQYPDDKKQAVDV